MTKTEEPTLNELVSLGSSDPLDEFFSANHPPTCVPLSPPPPPPPLFPDLPPPASPSRRIRMEDLEDTHRKLGSRNVMTSFELPNPQAAEGSQAFGPPFVDSRMFLFKQSPENGDHSGLWNAITPDDTPMEIDTPLEGRTYTRTDDRCVDPWNVAANQNPPWWRRATYRQRGINWREADPSGRMPLSWLRRYGIEVEGLTLPTPNSTSSSSQNMTRTDAVPRALAGTLSVSSVQHDPQPAAQCPQPLLTNTLPAVSSRSEGTNPTSSKKQKVIGSITRDHGGKASSSRLDIRKAAATNARLVSMKQLRRESSNENIMVA